MEPECLHDGPARSEQTGAGAALVGRPAKFRRLLITQAPGAVYGVEEHPGRVRAFRRPEHRNRIRPGGKIPTRAGAPAPSSRICSFIICMMELSRRIARNPCAAPDLRTQFGFQVLQPKARLRRHAVGVYAWQPHRRDGRARAHRPQDQANVQGDSVGHWEGDALVIDTTNLNDKDSGSTLPGIPTVTRSM